MYADDVNLSGKKELEILTQMKYSTKTLGIKKAQ